MANDLTGRFFVLRTIKHGESSLIIHLLDRSGSKQVMYARAALVSKKRFGGGVFEPTHYIEAKFRPARSGEGMGHLIEARLLNGFSKLRLDYDRLAMGRYFVKVIGQTAQEEMHDSEQVFDLLGFSLQQLETTLSPAKLKVHFLAQYLFSQGVLPSVDSFGSLTRFSVQETEKLELSEPQVKGFERALEDHLKAYLGGMVF
ncbi:MAG: recombination protein O N-terminal domain-containing protein [Bdellovibrionales bacterium]|nr:recombination protein O N-terminal domain-containing protein [Bdellovibrionales bacterium]